MEAFMPKKKQLTFEGSLKTMVGKLNTSRNGIQLHLLNIGMLAVTHNNLEGYVEKTINALDEYGQHTHAEAAIAWIEKFYGYIPNDEGKQLSWEGAEFIRNNYKLAKECKFWTLAKPKQSSFKGCNFEGLIHGALDKADKVLKQVHDGKVSDEDQKLVVIDLDQMRRVRAALKAA